MLFAVGADADFATEAYFAAVPGRVFSGAYGFLCFLQKLLLGVLTLGIRAAIIITTIYHIA